MCSEALPTPREPAVLAGESVEPAANGMASPLDDREDVVIDLQGVWKRYYLRSVHAVDLKHALLHLPSLLRERRGTEFWALKDVSLQVRRGECVGIIGPNGSGKSTLLGLIAGVLRPDRGRVTVRGRVAPLLELGLGFHPELTGRENVILNGLILGLGRRELQARLDEIIIFAELGEFIDQPVRTYSSGMYMRLAFSVAVHVQADILLLDEVLAVGDMRFQEKCLQRLRTELAGGKTALFVSHDANMVTQFCNWAVLLRQGQIQRNGPPAEILRAYRGV